ncbi:MAG: hypothetical protein HUU28_15090 [Planctomycetaceae bacterium]|nr:hypothetical protein [Planctomycetaceae bacterium]
MRDLLDLYDATDDSNDGAQLTERRIGQEPALVVLFSKSTEAVKLHYEDAPEFATFVVCPGDRCPLCHLGKNAQDYWLIPVYDLEDAKVKVLRVSTRKSVGALAPSIVALLRKQSTKPEITQISRTRGNYKVTSSPLQETADDGREAIAAFLKECEHGLKLVSAFPSPTAAELASCERTRRKLEALGNYFTDADRQPAADVPDPDAEGD